MNTFNAIKKKLLAPIEPGNRTPLPARWKKYHRSAVSGSDLHQQQQYDHTDSDANDGYRLIQEEQSCHSPSVFDGRQSSTNNL